MHPINKLIAMLMNRSLVLHLIMQSHIFSAKIAENSEISKKTGLDIFDDISLHKTPFSMVLLRKSCWKRLKNGKNLVYKTCFLYMNKLLYTFMFYIYNALNIYSMYFVCINEILRMNIQSTVNMECVLKFNGLWNKDICLISTPECVV